MNASRSQSMRTNTCRRAAVAVALVAFLVACGSNSTSRSADDAGAPATSTDHAGDHAGDGRMNLEPAEVMGRPDRIIAGPQGNDGQFVVECELSHTASDDPIVYPGRAGASHLHAFFGNNETEASSRAADLIGAETSCDDFRDTASYWVPVLFDGASVIEPVYAVAYYRAGVDVDPTTVTAFPPGLTMIAGDPLARTDQPVEVVAWTCGNGANRTVLPRECPVGAELGLAVTFPDCWDGKNLDSDGHRRHLRYSSKGSCPDTHPVAIPQLLFHVLYPVHGDASALRLSSGTLLTGHADFINAWDQEHLEHEVELCIRQQNVCAISSGRRPA